MISELRYTAWGEVRDTLGETPTNYTYTGQYSNTADFGLMYYNARWYDPALGKFAQADSIVPGGVQGYDRYAYVSNNPIKYTDPTGHMQACERGDEGLEGVLHSSSCGSGANMKQIEKAFDKEHHGKGYSEYYAKIHGVVTDLDTYLENINIEYEKETDAMRDKRISRIENQLIASVNSARLTGQRLYYGLRQDAWKSDAEFPKILGGGYIIDNSSGTLGDGTVPGSGEFSSALISEIVNYYTRTPPPPFFSGDDWMHNP